jgi:hypothetical protein
MQAILKSLVNPRRLGGRLDGAAALRAFSRAMSGLIHFGGICREIIR